MYHDSRVRGAGFQVRFGARIRFEGSDGFNPEL